MRQAQTSEKKTITETAPWGRAAAQRNRREMNPFSSEFNSRIRTDKHGLNILRSSRARARTQLAAAARVRKFRRMRARLWTHTAAAAAQISSAQRA